MRIELRLSFVDGVMPSIEYAAFATAIHWPDTIRIPVAGDLLTLSGKETYDVAAVCLLPFAMTDRPSDNISIGVILQSVKALWSKSDSHDIDSLIQNFSLQNWTLIRSQNDEPVPNEDTNDI